MSRTTTLAHSSVLAAPQVRTGRLGQRDVVVGVAAPNRDGVATRFESLLGVLADGLEQPVAHPAVVVVVGDDERLVDQLTQHVDHIRRVELVAGQDRLGGRQVTAAGEHRQPVQRVTFGRGRAGRRTSRSCSAASGGAPAPHGCRA